MTTTSAETQTKSQLDTISHMMKLLVETAKDMKNAVNMTSDDKNFHADVLKTIHEYPAGIVIREGWHPPGDRDGLVIEYTIFLHNGRVVNNPHLITKTRIVGSLDAQGTPQSAHLEYGFLGNHYTGYKVTNEEQSALLTFAKCFNFVE